MLALGVSLALSALTAASAFAAGAPIAETRQAVVLGQTEANLTGYINPNGAESKWHFEYGTTTSYGSSTKETATNGLAHVASRVVTGLTPSTTYHYRMVASNSYGTSYGADVEFKTHAVPPEFARYGNPTTEAILPETTLEFGSRYVECKAGSVTGSITSEHLWSGQLKFTGCYYEHYACQTEGAAHAEIDSETLTGKLVYLSHTSKTVALLLKGASKFMQLTNNCLFGGWPVTGELLIPVSPVNTDTSRHYISLQGSRGVETAHEYEYEASAGVWHTATTQLETEVQGKTAIIAGSGISLASSPFEIVA